MDDLLTMGALAVLAAQAPDDIPEWWEHGYDRDGKPNRVMPIELDRPEVPAELEEAFAAIKYERPQHLFDQAILVRAQHLYQEILRVSSQNADARARARYETRLRWRAFYAGNLYRQLSRQL